MPVPLRCMWDDSQISSSVISIPIFGSLICRTSQPELVGISAFAPSRKRIEAALTCPGLKRDVLRVAGQLAVAALACKAELLDGLVIPTCDDVHHSLSYDELESWCASTRTPRRSSLTPLWPLSVLTARATATTQPSSCCRAPVAAGTADQGGVCDRRRTCRGPQQSHLLRPVACYQCAVPRVRGNWRVWRGSRSWPRSRGPGPLGGGAAGRGGRRRWRGRACCRRRRCPGPGRRCPGSGLRWRRS